MADASPSDSRQKTKVDIPQVDNVNIADQLNNLRVADQVNINIPQVDKLSIADQVNIHHQRAKITTNSLSIQGASVSNSTINAHTLNLNINAESKLALNFAQFQKFEDPYQKFLGE